MAEGHAEADRLREARFVGAIRVAVNGSAEEVDRFLGRPGADDGFDSLEDILRMEGGA